MYRRSDGLVVVRRMTWQDVVLTRDVAALTGLFFAWGLCVLGLFAALLVPPLIATMLGASAFPAIWAAGAARCREPGPRRVRLAVVPMGPRASPS